MSSRVRLYDGRIIELANCANIIAHAQQTLAATASSVGCGHATVTRTNIDVSRAKGAVDSTTFQRGVDIKDDADVKGMVKARSKIGIEDSSALQSKLTAQGPAYEIGLTQWSGDLDGKPIEITSAELSGPGERIAADLECAALDGARMVIVEHVDEEGNKSYQIGLDEILFDDKKQVKEERHRKALEAFMTALADTSPDKDDGGAAAQLTNNLARSFQAAGLKPARSTRTKTGDTVVFSNRQPDASTEKTVKAKALGAEGDKN